MANYVKSFMAKNNDIVDKKARDGIKNFILLMLGAPVVKVELDPQHLDLCVNRTCDMMSESTKAKQWCESKRLMVAQDGSLAHAKLVLGRIRSKFGYYGSIDTKGVTKKSRSIGANSFVPLDGRELLNEGERQYLEWQFKVFGEDDK
jgi:hypothetical protein